MSYNNRPSEVCPKMTQHNLSLNEIVTRFVHRYRSPDTRRAYRHDINQFLGGVEPLCQMLEAILKIPFEEMREQVVRFLSSIRNTDPYSGQVRNAATVNRKRYALAAFFRFLVNDHCYPRNPVDGLDRLAVSPISTTAMLTEKEIRSVMLHLKDRHEMGHTQFRDYLMVLGLFHFALRRRELAGIRWCDISRNPPHLRVIQKRGREKILPVPSQYFVLLDRFEEKFGRSSEYIFHPVQNPKTKIHDKPVSTNYVLHVVQQVGAAVLPDRKVTPHSFRSSFVSLARENGLDDREIMNATGHTSNTMVNYYDVRNRLTANAVNFFASWID